MAVAFGAIAGFGIDSPGSRRYNCSYRDTFSIIATTVALSLSIRVIGGFIGFPIYSDVFANKLEAKLPEYVTMAAAKASLIFAPAKPFSLALLHNTENFVTIEGATPAVIGAAITASQ